MPKERTRRYSIEIKDATGRSIWFAAADWTDEERRIAIAQDSRLCGMPDENCFTEAPKKPDLDMPDSVLRVVMSVGFWITSTARAQIDFAQDNRNRSWRISGSRSLLVPCQEQSGPAQMHPLLCGAALVDAVIGFTPSERHEDR
jgi:hypothetical protein